MKRYHCVYKKGLFKRNDYFGFRLDQPLKIEDSDVELNLPFRRDKNKNIHFSSMEFDLSPKYREINSEFVYEVSTNRLDFFGRMGVSNDKGHQKSGIEPYLMVDIEFRLD